MMQLRSVVQTCVGCRLRARAAVRNYPVWSKSRGHAPGPLTYLEDVSHVRRQQATSDYTWTPPACPNLI